MSSPAAPRPNSKALLAWYDAHRRSLPWRAPAGVASDPYAVWLSEIMLQQTTVAAVKPYFSKFLMRWPTVRDLAAAEREDVMKAWAGLGYYSRARNLHDCAQRIAADLAGVFPDNETELRKLPGLGPYTAAAVAAIAFGRRAVVVDGNVERVVARLFAIAEPFPAAKKAIREKAEQLTPRGRPGDFAQAMMDLGATVCTPKKPACLLCPFSRACVAKAQERAEFFPVRAAKKGRPRRAGVVFYAQRSDGAVLVRTRAPRGLLGGMTELPGSEWFEMGDVDMARDAPLAAEWRRLPGVVEHVFTHFALRLTVFAADFGANAQAPPDCRWSLDLDAEAFPSVMRKAAGLAQAQSLRPGARRA